MSPAAISAHMSRILEEENLSFEAEALPLISRAAAGSMRDALSLLDQALAHGGGKVASQDVGEMLGAIDQGYLVRLVECIADEDAAAAVAIADDMQARSLSFDTALADLASLLLRIALAQSVPDALADAPERARLEALANRLDAESVQLYYQIALQGREDLPLAPDEHAGFLMTVLRMLAFRPEGVGLKIDLPRSAGEKPRAPTPRTPQRADSDWPQLVQALQVTGAARELARNAELQRRENGLFQLVVPKTKSYLAERNYVEKLKSALDQHLGSPVRVSVAVGEIAGATAALREAGEREARHAEAVKAVQDDGFVKDLVNLFDGKVVDSTIRENK
jgi:DNA polymerase-3 subunit gamma/tau